MKYNVGDILFYVNPFVFTVERVQIDFMHDEHYCDRTYAMFEEKDLYLTLEEAVFEATIKLNEFYAKKIKELIELEEPPFTHEDESCN